MHGGGKERAEEVLDNVVVRRRSILFLQIPRIHAAKFQLLDRSTRNVKWITIKAAGDDDAEKKNIMIQTCTYAVALFLPVIT